MKISDEALIAALRNIGLDSAEVRVMLDKWTEQEEKLVGPNPEDSILFNMKRAAIYAQAGYIDEALDNLDDATLQAVNEGRGELIEEIKKQVRNLGKQ